MSLARLASLLAGGAHVIQHPIGFVGMLVRVRGLLARILRFVEFHAQVIILVKLNGNPVDVTSGFRRAWRGAVGAAITVTELALPAASHRADELLEFVQQNCVQFCK